MALINATFLVNSLKGTESLVVNLPKTYQFGSGERLIERQIPEEEYELLKGDKYKHLKIYRFVDKNTTYTDKTVPPKGLDYKTGLTVRLYPKPFVSNDGFLTKMEYYSGISFNSSIGDWEYSDEILEATFQYQRDPATEFVISRTKTLSWYREDGTKHHETKVMFKPYSLIQMDEEAIRRRSNIIALIKIELAKFNAWALSRQYPDPKLRPNANDAAKALFTPFAPYMLGFINGGDKSIVKFTQNFKHPFLDYHMPTQNNMTVREFILSRVS